MGGGRFGRSPLPGFCHVTSWRQLHPQPGETPWRHLASAGLAFKFGHALLKEGRNRIVRRLFEKLGFVVSRLMRVRYGPVDLPSRVKRGQYYELTDDETRRLLDWLEAALEPVASPPEPPQREPGRRARE